MIIISLFPNKNKDELFQFVLASHEKIQKFKNKNKNLPYKINGFYNFWLSDLRSFSQVVDFVIKIRTTSSYHFSVTIGLRI